MAQAARQNLRMQKELKLLLTDPPPGVSLSDDSTSSSLSNINAKIKGPEGTVYANGVFKIKIQIPDRYPFQPPNVTFATPIYHPNIDNGGRICLDILNLPPKGAWQPSLNISTVLMSIGLLLSEPNPDDGLMCEASREYKYNKQTFDQKATSMTEKYARSNASVETTLATTKPSSPVLMEEEGQNQEPRSSDIEHHTMEHKRLSRVSRKLSLESSLVPSQKKHEVNIAHTGSLSTNSALVSAMLEVAIHNGLTPCASYERDASLSSSLTESSDASQNMANNESASSKSEKKRLGIGRKLSLQPNRSVSLKSPLLQLSDNCDTKIPRHQALSEETEDCGMRKKHEVNIAQSGSLSTKSAAVSAMPGVRIYKGELPCAGKEGNASLSASPKKLPLVDPPQIMVNNENAAKKCENKWSGIGRKLSLQPERSVSLQSPLLPLSDRKLPPHQALTENCTMKKKLGISRKLSLGLSTSKSKWEDDDNGNKENINPNYQLKSEKEEEVVMSDATIVLDSEDSDEDVKVSRRSRLSIARKPLAGKRKAKA